MNFGQDGARSSFSHCKNENLAEGNEETFRRERKSCRRKRKSCRRKRKSCRRKRRNFQKGDVVLLEAVYNRNNWPIARIIETIPDKHEIVRTIELRLGDAAGAEQRELVRPITKIVLLVKSDSPTKSDENIAKLPGSFGGDRWNDDIITGLLK